MLINFNNKKPFTQGKMFFDEETMNGLQRFDQARYPELLSLAEKQKGFFWRPQGVPMSADRICFQTRMKEEHRHLFTSNLQRQIMLDSIQGRGPALAFLPCVSDPAAEDNINYWNMCEGSIHSKSYTHIIQAVYPEPDKVFDDIKNVKEIVSAANSINAYYTRLIDINFGRNPNVKFGSYEHKKAFWLCMVAVNALEAIRFFVSFATNFALVENQMMVRSGDILQYICRDEAVHLSLVTFFLKKMPIECEEFRQIEIDCRDEATFIFEQAAAEEVDWGKYLLSRGPILGFNLSMFEKLVEHLLLRRLRTFGYTKTKLTPHPFPWMTKYTNSHARQEAPQEKNVTGYVLGGVRDDYTPGMFGDNARQLLGY